MAVTPPTPAPAPAPRPNGFHGAVSDFKRRLLEATLTQAGGNRTRAARALGLQRTYLLGNGPPGKPTHDRLRGRGRVTRAAQFALRPSRDVLPVDKKEDGAVFVTA